MTSVNDFIEHYGVKGMKWGVRNKSRSSRDARVKKSRQKIVNKRRSLSDGDIKKYIARLSEEKKLKTLINEDIKPGRTIAKRIVSDSGQKVARTIIYGGSLYILKSALEKKFDPAEAAKYLTPKPKNK